MLYRARYHSARRHWRLAAALVVLLALALPSFAAAAPVELQGAAPAGAEIGVRPDRGAPGTPIQIGGRGFNPNEAVQVYWDPTRSDPGLLLCSTRADGLGRFRCSATVPSDASPGRHLIVAFRQGHQVTNCPYTTFWVELPTTCPRTQGYWKNHPEAWPVSSLTLGSQTYSQDELLAVLALPPRGDASVILAHQLIAAKLNDAAGADTTAVDETIAHADSLLAQYSGKLPYGVDPASPEGQAMVNDAETLDRFNNGELTPGCGGS